jgi:membrane-bound ClpP family serine protease
VAKSHLCRIWIWSCLLLLLVAACEGPLARIDPDKQDAAPRTPEVLVVTLSGKLGTPEIARCMRALRTAESEQCKFVVFRFDWAGSQGEDVEDVQSLLDRMASSPVVTVALLKGTVTHGAAHVAVCSNQVYMLPGAELGEITKPDQDWSELLSGEPESAMNQRLDAVRGALQGGAFCPRQGVPRLQP